MNCRYCWGTGQKISHRNLGRQVRSARIKAGVSLDYLARSLAVSGPFLCLLEQGKRSWTPGRFHKAFQVLARPITNAP